MTTPVLTVENLGKRYRRGSYNFASFKLQTASWLARVRGKPDPNAPILAAESDPNPEFWALRNVSFAVEAGSAVGVIGTNGAGKSTLLKILSRVTAPTEGRVIVHGATASLLEVGTGFHPELTGRENVFLSGALLGMSTSEVKRVLDRIVAFSGVEPFLDTPIKRYSSGMVVRLGFSVALHLKGEILFLDEVLAVGDEAFSRQCLDALRQAIEAGRSLLFVSHNLSSVEQLCGKTLALNGGETAFFGDTKEAVAHYRAGVVPLHKKKQGEEVELPRP